LKFCHQCGKPLTLGVEKYCPFCGTNLPQQKQGEPLAERDTQSIGITDTKGDVFGAGVSGSGNIIGKEVGYTVQGNIINLHIDSVSNEVIEGLRNILTIPTQIEQISTIKNERNTKEIENKSYKTMVAKQQISQVLEDVKKVEEKEGTQIQEIKAGELQISRNELLLTQYILKGNEYYYKNEYNSALEWYDKAIEINPNYAGALTNKGVALDSLGRHEEAIKYFDKAIELDPNLSPVWNNKGIALEKLGRYEEAIKYYDKAIEINPDYADAWNNKGVALDTLGRHEEAIKYYDKALEIDPNNVLAQTNKTNLLNKHKKKKGWFR
jgi:tetratricopeptide (TPR) repeat protein